MGSEGIRKPKVDSRKVDQAYNNIQAQASAYYQAFSPADALQMAYERNISGQGFLNLAEKEVLVAKIRQEIAALQNP